MFDVTNVEVFIFSYQEFWYLIKEVPKFNKKLEKQQEIVEALVEENKRQTVDRMKENLELRNEVERNMQK